MFSGIIEQTGRVLEVRETPVGRRLRISVPGWQERCEVGESICISGCCLTLADVHGEVMSFDVIPQTLAMTTLGSLGSSGSPGSPAASGSLLSPGQACHVNVERAVTPRTLLGGHLVQGHVDAVGEVREVKREGGEVRLRIGIPEPIQPFQVAQGSIALDGVSLTIAATGAGWIDVCLIPVTLELTTLARLAPGDRVNLETDSMAKLVHSAVQRYLSARPV